MVNQFDESEDLALSMIDFIGKLHIGYFVSALGFWIVVFIFPQVIVLFPDVVHVACSTIWLECKLDLNQLIIASVAAVGIGCAYVVGKRQFEIMKRQSEILEIQTSIQKNSRRPFISLAEDETGSIFFEHGLAYPDLKIVNCGAGTARNIQRLDLGTGFISDLPPSEKTILKLYHDLYKSKENSFSFSIHYEDEMGTNHRTDIDLENVGIWTIKRQRFF